MAHTKETVISTEGQEVIGNDANRFDTWRQTTTIGPEVSSPDEGPPEQASGGNVPKAS